MPIDWNDRNKRKALRLTLQRVYPDYDDLEGFVDEELDENLAEIASDQNVAKAARALIKWMRSRNRLDEVFEAFSQENPNDSGILELQMTPMVAAPQPKVDDSSWDTLFDSFQANDLLELKRAFGLATQLALTDDFKGIGLFDIETNSVAAIRDRLERFDSPRLAVLFASRAIDELTRSDPAGDRDLSVLKTWCDHMIQDHNVDTAEPEIATPKAGYLMVSVIGSGRVTKGDREVTLFPELRVDSPATSSAAGLQPMDKVKCKWADIGKQLSQLTHCAEDILIPMHCEEVTLELFLAWPQLDEHTTQWDAVDRRGNSEKFKNRRYVVRSLDRFNSFGSQPALRAALEKNWALLHTCIKDKAPYQHFHRETCFSEAGQLRARLSKKTGLKFIGQMPVALGDRKIMFDNIIDSAVPVALWIENTERSADDISKEIEAIFKGACLTCFDTVAECLMQSRADTGNYTAQKLRVLLDCPERWPKSLPRNISKSTRETEIFEDDDSIVSL